MSTDPHKDDQLGSELEALTTIVTALKRLSPNNRERVINSALTLLGVDAAQTPSQGVSSTSHSAVQLSLQSSASQRQAIVDIRTLKEQKAPRSANEMAALVAYYLSEVAPESERKETLGTEDIEKYFKQASFKLPGNANSTLHNSKNSGYLDSIGAGEFKLNPVGYNLIVHTLPSDLKLGAPKGKARNRNAAKPKTVQQSKGSQKAKAPLKATAKKTTR